MELQETCQNWNMWGQKDGREERALRCWSCLRLGVRISFHRLETLLGVRAGRIINGVSEMQVGPTDCQGCWWKASLNALKLWQL